MPILPSPSYTVVKTSTSSFDVIITAQSGVFVDVYIRKADSTTAQYTLYATREGSGSVSVTNRAPFQYYLIYVITRDAQNNISLPIFSSIDLNISDSVMASIKSKWYSTPSLVSMFKGGLFANEAPEAIGGKPLILPYCIMKEEDTDFTWTMEASYFETSTINFVLFASGASAADLCLALIRDHFDWTTLTFQKAGSYTIEMRPNHSNLTSENFRYKDGNLIFRGSVIYDIMTGRYL